MPEEFPLDFLLQPLNFVPMAETKKQQVYDESKIKTLSSLEHIRLRTGMYIGRIGDGSHYDDGCYILLKEVIDNGIDEFLESAFKQGKLKNEKKGKSTNEADGTLIRFEPDPAIFKEVEFKPEHVERRLRHYSYLNSGLKLIYNGQTFQSRNGLLDLVMEDLQADNSEPIYPPLHYSEKTLEFCFTHSNSRFGESFYSFVNGQYTSDGGTHLSAFREGLLKAVNEYAREKFEGDDVRESMVGAISIRLKDPIFESQTKNKLGNTEIRTELVNRVREELLHFFNRNKEIAEKIIAKVQDTRQLRKELQEVKKLARERAKAITIRIPQLKDCKNHLDKKREKGYGTQVFLT